MKRGNLPLHWIQARAEMGAAQEKQMEVCDVCGAFLIVNDVQQRVEDHLMGKQHVGYGKLKAALDELLQRRKADRNDRNAPPLSRSPNRNSRNPSDSSFKNDRHKLRERSRSRDRGDRNGFHRYKDHEPRHKDDHRHQVCNLKNLLKHFD